jgi:ethanolamine ammonia-lyase small subunit
MTMANETTSTSANKAAPAPAAAAQEMREPIIIDMGKKKRRQVRKLRKGRECSLMDRIKEALAEGIAAKAIPANAQPVIVVVKEKKKKNKVGKMWGLG